MAVGWDELDAGVDHRPVGALWRVMAYDSVRDRTVLFGGYGPAVGPTRYLGVERLGLDPGATRVLPGTRFARHGLRQYTWPKTVLFGGAISAHVAPGRRDTWDSGMGLRGRRCRPAARRRVPGAMAYDSARGSMCCSAATPSSRRWWLLRHIGMGRCDWTARGIPPSGAHDHGLRQRPARGWSCLAARGFAGNVLGDTWEYHLLPVGACTRIPNATPIIAWTVCAVHRRVAGRAKSCNLSSPGSCTDVKNAPDADTCTGNKVCDPRARACSRWARAARPVRMCFGSLL